VRQRDLRAAQRMCPGKLRDLLRDDGIVAVERLHGVRAGEPPGVDAAVGATDSAIGALAAAVAPRAMS
jgi:hypothetical protein